ncbi:hypothetical protein RJ640_002817 [Escallonia rubra]|uniref:Uncharacterized protein n=1 Tax=Escallonia rubra TaxID=112253 RepID=A0AA88QGK4_9ASTE|nr:hypothetical protein RJ640_002817 [Escallonia rubra]
MTSPGVASVSSLPSLSTALSGSLTSATRSTQPSYTRALNLTLRWSASAGTSKTPDIWPPSSWTAPRLSSSTSASSHSLLLNSSGTRPASMPSPGHPTALATSALPAMTPRLSFGTSPPMGQPIEGGLDPILAYTAGAEIEQLQWSSSQPDWVAIAFSSMLQILRV